MYPQKGDIIMIDFDPQRGNEIMKIRPALVVSSSKYNKYTNRVAVMPITHARSRVKVPSLIKYTGKNIDGYIDTLQLYTLDYGARGWDYVEHVQNSIIIKTINAIQTDILGIFG
ncbi:type II toxin-antitoxin system PemK/MazF family toxin [Companilactobacillus jidongensis]|uniref:type II toxin-antitoxin system PemK/MazF family toxin n=1 Tax=Companilactobacillus jidongensis TaxID=2486006 RepID=UPI000F788503|nr:type II toxin-antitoxin system PemK/MazF family toxin [Companilactobacillus jidongensis]